MTRKLVKLGSVCDLKNGFAFKSKLFKEKGLPILRISNIQNERIDTRRPVYFDAKDYKIDFRKYEVNYGDLLIAMSGATTGKIGFNESETTFYLNQRVGKLVPGKNLNKKYLYYFLSTKIKENLKISKGAAQPNLSSEQIKNIEIFLPSLSEQQRIVAKLDLAFTEFNKTKSINTRINTSLEKLSDKLTKLKFDSIVEKKPLGSLCDFLNGYAFKSSETVDVSNVQLLRMGNLYNNKLDLERTSVFYPENFANDYNKFIINPGDIVMTLTGTVGKRDYGYALEIPETKQKLLLNQRILKLHNFKSNIVNKMYLLFYLNSQIFLNILFRTANGTRQANLSSETIKKLKIPIPSMDNQIKILEKLKLIDENKKILLKNLKTKFGLLNSLKFTLTKDLIKDEAA